MERLLHRTFEKVDAAWLDARPGLKVIGVPATGLDHIDEAECERRGVKVVSLRGERKFLDGITSTAEHTFGLILALARGYKAAFAGERTLGTRLSGKTLGVIGNRGRIGSQVSRMAKAFGMRVNGYDVGRGMILRALDSDFVTVHVPLRGNEGFIRDYHFRFMRPTTFFVNTSRPGVVEKGALLESLKSATIAGAATDFLNDEDDGLREYARDHANLLLTDHLGGNTAEDRAATDAFIEAKMAKIKT